LPGRDNDTADIPVSVEGTDVQAPEITSDTHAEDRDVAIVEPLQDRQADRMSTGDQTTAAMLRLNTRLKHAEREYLVQSTIDPVSKRMRCDIFGEGVRLSSIDGDEISGMPTERLFPMLKKMHERAAAELDRVFKLSLSATNVHEPALLNYVGDFLRGRAIVLFQPTTQPHWA